MKWDETLFNTPFGTKLCKKPIFSRFSHTNVWGNRAKTRYPLPWYVAQGFWTWNCICSIPLPSWSFEKKSQITLLQNIKCLLWCSYDMLSIWLIIPCVLGILLTAETILLIVESDKTYTYTFIGDVLGLYHEKIDCQSTNTFRTYFKLPLFTQSKKICTVISL